MRKILSAATAIAVLTSFTGCSNKENKQESGGNFTVELMQYNEAKINMAEDFSEIVSVSSNAVAVSIFGVKKSGGYAVYSTDFNFADYSEIKFEPQEDETVLTSALTSTGNTLILTELDDEVLIYVYNNEGKLTATHNIGRIEGVTNYCTVIASGDYYYINCLSGLYAVNKNGQLAGAVNTQNHTVSVIAVDSERKPVVLLYGENGGLSTAVLDGTSISDITKCGGEHIGANSLSAGKGEYSLLASTSGGLYGLKENNWIHISDLTYNTMPGFSICGMVPVNETDVAVLYSGNGNREMSLLTQMDISEMKSRTTITMAVFSQNGYVDENIKKFNAENEDYRVELVNYFDINNLEHMEDRLKLDIVSGNAPDIIEFSAEIMADDVNPNTFCDLYEFLDKDPELSADMIIPNIREGMEREGRMIMIPSYFTFMTIPAKTGFTGVKENWSIDDFITAYDSMPEGMEIFYEQDHNLRQRYFTDIIQYNFFVDYDKAECYFDSPEFIKALNFFNDRKIGLTNTEYNNLNTFGSLGDHTYDVYLGKSFANIRSNDIFQYGDLINTVRGLFKDECTFAGYPGDTKGNGSFISLGNSFAITANSQNKEGAWAYIRTLLTEDYYYDIERYNMFSVVEKRFDETMEELMGKQKYMVPDENGNFSINNMEEQDWRFTICDPTNTSFDNVVDEVLKPFTEEECEHYKDVIKSARIMRYDSTVNDICFEEELNFFDEKCTAEECANRIQSRVSIYLSERYK